MKNKKTGNANFDKKLSKKDVNKACWRYIFFAQATQNFERMMGLAFCYVIAPIVNKLYKNDPEKKAAALKRHMQFFNTEPQLGAVIPGITIAMEEAMANGENVDEDMITSTKNALMGPLAGVGDSMIVGTWSPILLSIAMSMSLVSGSVMGPIFFMVTWLASVVGMQWYLFHKGYSLGLDATELLFSNKALTDKLTTALTVLGLIVIGGVASTTVAPTVIMEYVSGDMILSLQSKIFDVIMPNVLGLVITLVSWILMSKKNVSAIKMILILAIFAAVMVIFGIL